MIEGGASTRRRLEGDVDNPTCGDVYTGRNDEILIQLQKNPGAADDPRQARARRGEPAGDPARSSRRTRAGTSAWTHIDADPSSASPTTRSTSTDELVTPVRVTVNARPDAAWEDPQTAVITFVRDDATPSSDVATRSRSTRRHVDSADRSTTRKTRPDLPATSSRTSAPAPARRPSRSTTTRPRRDLDRERRRHARPEVRQRACTTPGPTDDSTATTRSGSRSSPTGDVDVAILTDGMVDVVAIDGDSSTTRAADYEVIGGYVPTRLFLGNLVDLDADGLHAHARERLRPRQLRRRGLRAPATDPRHDRRRRRRRRRDRRHRAPPSPTLASRSHRAAAAGGAPRRRHEQDRHGQLPRARGLVGGPGHVRRHVRRDAAQGGWQLVRIDRRLELARATASSRASGSRSASDGAGACIGTTGRFKIAIIRGDNETKDNKIEFRSYVDLDGVFHLVDDLIGVGRLGRSRPSSGGSPPVATFTTTNWYESSSASTCVADLGYAVPISRQGVKVFPVTTHGLSKLQGPLAVEGGVTGADRSLNLGVKLPGEKDGPLFKIGPQPPESKQIDVLNIFNDGAKEDGAGTMTSTTLSGLRARRRTSTSARRTRAATRRPSASPRSSRAGSASARVQFVDGKFQTNGAKSTIEVVNLLLGEGNDSLDIQGTLDPDDRREADRHDRRSPRATGTSASTVTSLTRPRRSTGRRRASSSASRCTSPASRPDLERRRLRRRRPGRHDRQHASCT